MWSWSSAVKIAPVWILRQIIGQSARRIANPRCHLGYEQLIADIDRLTADGTISLDPPWAKRKKQIFMHTYPRTVNPEVDPEGAYKEMNVLLKQMADEFQEAVKAGHAGSGGTIVLDGGTMLHNHLTARAQKEGPEMRKKGISAAPSPAATTTGRP